MENKRGDDIGGFVIIKAADLKKLTRIQRLYFVVETKSHIVKGTDFAILLHLYTF